MSNKTDTIPEFKHDERLTIAVGRSRMDKKWKNKEITWSDLVRRLCETRRTSETITEYKKLPKTEQSQIKDVGGFVGGTLKSGRRTAESVASRQLLTLDADFAQPDFWDLVLFTLESPAAAIYSTHKHTADKPRLRLLLPLSRPVSPDEYQAIARRVAADIDIEQFDDTTYQPHRLMFWPSTPVDGDYIFEYNDDAFLDADTYLARYEDWRDQSQWPESSRVHAEIRQSAAKQEDPTTKKGIVGAFCRTYSVTEAMDTFLPGVYEPCEADDRYTYTAGTSAAGAVVYEDGKFLFSHHSTDPCCGKLVNAFDLVRIHKFRNLDDDASPNTPPGRLPSYQAMQALAADDDRVKVSIGEERLAEVRQDFTADESDEGPQDNSWLTQMDINKWGKYESTAKNVKLILENDPALRGTAAIDDFAHRIVVLKDLPWRKRERSAVWLDSDDSSLRNYMEEIYGIRGRSVIEDALSEVTTRHAFNPLKEYLLGLVWDGIPRLDTVFIDYLGAEDTEFNRAISRKTLAAAVGRVLEPGIKFDTVLTLIGKQGQGKTSLVRKLAHGWHSESLVTVQGKDAMEHIQGFWLIELGELAAIRKADFELVKQFISKQEDSFRAAYGRRTERYPRQCIFIATTNRADFIRDQTGGRRWWPMQVDKERQKMSHFEELTDDVVGQIWAEAVDAFKGGEPLYLNDSMEAIAKELQEAHTDESPLAGLIYDFVDRPLPENWAKLDLGERRDFIHGDGLDTPEGTVLRDRICAMEIWVELLNGDPKKLTRTQSIEINDILRKMEGWEQPQGGIRFVHYGAQKGFVRKNLLQLSKLHEGGESCSD